MKTLLITQLFQIINKTSCKRNHKNRKVYCVIDMLWLSKPKCTGSICDNIFDLQRPQKPLHCSNKNGKWKRKEKILTARAFLLFWCTSCTACISQKFQVQDKIPTIWPLFADYLSVSYDYAVKVQTCVTNEVVYYLPSTKDDVGTIRILLLPNFSYETKYKYIVY